MTPYIVPLEAVRQADAPLVGAKAAVLGTLREAGFPVPPGLCITTAAFRLAVGARLTAISAVIHEGKLRDSADAVAASEAIAGLLADLVVPAPVMRALQEALPSVGNPETLLAVRSSATAEDSAAASFAGHYQSVIGVPRAALPAAIIAVWRSFFTPQALAARAAHRRLGAEEAMAVLILPVIEAECAGVCFSADPVNRRADQVVVTAAWGLGAGVVDGSVAADTAWVRRDGYAEGFEVAEHRVVEKRGQIVLAPEGGLQQVPVPADRRRAASLPTPWLQRVAQFGVAAEVLLGRPQDVEWAIAGGQVWVLQSRPLTALPPDMVPDSGFPVHWENEQDRRQAWVYYPYWRYVLQPLEMDYAHDRQGASRESCHYAGHEHFEKTKIVNGRCYTAWVPSDLPPGDRRVRRAALADLLVRLHGQGITPWEHWGPEVIQATERLAAFAADTADGPQLAAHLEDARGTLRRHWAIHGFIWQTYREPLYTAYAAVSGLGGPAVREAVEQLVEGVETSSTRLIQGLYELATSARQLPAVAALVADPPADVLDRLAALPAAAAFRSQLADFLAIFGDRSGVGYGADATIVVPTWREDPALVLRMAAAYLDPAVEPPATARARVLAEQAEEVERLCRACSNPEAIAELRRQLDYARREAAVTEEHNHYIDQMMNGQLRRAIMAAARWLVAHGALATPDQVFWLRFDEILAALRTAAPSPPAAVIAARQAQHAAWEKLTPPPLLGIPAAQLPVRPPLRDEAGVEAWQAGNRIVGLGASPGRRRGRARVVPSSVSWPDLLPGEVLVAENMGPRWTPLLPILGALVLDGGAVGQHHAVIAREYGVPAVLSTGNATRRIPEGAWVTVDGTAGTVDVEVPLQEEGSERWAAV